MYVPPEEPKTSGVFLSTSVAGVYALKKDLGVAPLQLGNGHSAECGQFAVEFFAHGLSALSPALGS
jgi:hypothetical protein